MKPLALTLTLIAGFLIGKIESPVDTKNYEAPQELKHAVIEAINMAYELGKMEKSDDIGLVRLTEDGVRRLIK